MHDIRRKKWAEKLDEAEREAARLGASPLGKWASAYRDALLVARGNLGRRRNDYFTPSDAAQVDALARLRVPRSV